MMTNGASPRPVKSCGGSGRRGAAGLGSPVRGTPWGSVGLVWPGRPEPVMTLARTAAQVLEGHVTLEVESIDRLYLNLYVPQLQRDLGVVGFFKQRGFRFASGAVMQPITNAFVASIKTFVNDAGVDLVRFNAGERKDDIAQRYLQASDGTEQMLFVGVAQDKARSGGSRSRWPAGV